MYYYNRVMLEMSLRFPRLWRARFDLILIMFVGLYGLTGLLLTTLERVAPEWWEGRTAIGMLVTIASLLATGFWLYSISKTLRLREIVKESNHPSFAVVFLVSALLLGPILWVLYPIVGRMIAGTIRAAQMGRSPVEAFGGDGTALALAAIVYWFLFLMIGSMFVKAMLLSSSMWVFGAGLLNTFWFYTWLAIIIAISGLMAFLPDQSMIGRLFRSTSVYITIAIYLIIITPVIRDLIRGARTSSGLLSALCLPQILPVLAFIGIAYGLSAYAGQVNSVFMSLLELMGPTYLLWGTVAVTVVLYVAFAELSFYIVYRLTVLPNA